jgi:hypothetical protein
LVEHLRDILHTFANNYQSVMWRLRECPLNDEQLGAALGISGNAIRSRRAKPDLWKLSDVERLATYFTISVTACTQLHKILNELPTHMKELTSSERRRIERMLLIKIAQLEAYNKSDWPVKHLLRMHQSLVAVTQQSA